MTREDVLLEFAVTGYVQHTDNGIVRTGKYPLAPRVESLADEIVKLRAQIARQRENLENLPTFWPMGYNDDTAGMVCDSDNSSDDVSVDWIRKSDVLALLDKS